MIPFIVGFSVVALVVGFIIGGMLKKSAIEAQLVATRTGADAIMESAKKEADNTRREAELHAKDKIFQGRQEFEKEVQASRKEFQIIEKRILSKEDGLDKKFTSLERREVEVARREKGLAGSERKIQELDARAETVIKEQKEKLESISGLSVDEAKRIILQDMENESRHEAGVMIKRIEDEANQEAEKKSKEIIALAIQRYAGDYVSERTVSVVHLPSDEMKGRIIGREGRNIRAIEAITGMDVIIDDTPEAVIISGHNPIRREVARISLERLVSDGRIHPARIEEVVAKVEEEVDKSIREAGERAVFDTGLHGVHVEVQKLIGKLKYRTSYAQNVYAHSLEVSFICGIMAAELKLSVKTARRVGLLHDIGKAVDHEVEGPHAAIGGDLAKKYGERPKIVAAIAQHHDDRPESIYGLLVQAADTLSAARPGARREMYESYIKRLDDLEKIATDFNGVDKVYALQAGREIRVMVEGDKVNDSAAVLLSRDIAKKIEAELSYPGQVKVTVVRETRAVDYAR
jgi:ribonuclease Y